MIFSPFARSHLNVCRSNCSSASFRCRRNSSRSWGSSLSGISTRAPAVGFQSSLSSSASSPCSAHIQSCYTPLSRYFDLNDCSSWIKTGAAPRLASMLMNDRCCFCSSPIRQGKGWYLRSNLDLITFKIDRPPVSANEVYIDAGSP